MKLRLLSLGSTVLAMAALAAFARPASAGLDFTDTATLAAASPTVTLNGGGVGTSVFIPEGFVEPPALAASTSRALLTATDPGLQTAAVQWSYNGLHNGVVAAIYSTEHGDPLYEMVVQFGEVSIPLGSSVILSQIRFSEGLGFFSIYDINYAITAADAGTKLFINIPEFDIPADQRDEVTIVELQFAFFGPSSIGINAVVNPEPGTIALFGAGLLGLAGVVRARRRRPQPSAA